MEFITAENLLALLTLTALEIVLGIDNIVFISIIVGKLPKAKQKLARQVGLLLAMLMRIALLLGISWVMRLTDPLFSVLEKSFSGRDLILLLGGIFLIGKSTHEIHHKIEPAEEGGNVKRATTMASAITQIVLLDIIFSLDSVITAIGMAQSIAVMIIAVMVAVAIMMIFARSIGEFIEQHPTFKMLALSFLLLIGVMLVADGFGQHIDKAYIYFAMGFSLLVEFLNMRVRKDPSPKAQKA